MTMHLAHPALTMGGKRKGKIKFRNSAEAQKARQLDADWKELQKKWEVDADDKARRRALESVYQRWFSRGFARAVVGYIVLAAAKVKMWLGSWHRAQSYEVDEEAADHAMAEPDFEFFMLMHKLLKSLKS